MVKHGQQYTSTCTTIRCVHGPLWSLICRAIRDLLVISATKLYPTRRLQGLQYEGAAGAERMVSVALANGHDCKGERGSGRLV